MAKRHRRVIIAPTPTSVRTPTAHALDRFPSPWDREIHAELMEQCPDKVNELLVRAVLAAADSYGRYDHADSDRTDDERVYARLAPMLRKLVEDRECDRCGGWKFDIVKGGLPWRDVESLDYLSIARVIFEDAEALQPKSTP